MAIPRKPRVDPSIGYAYHDEMHHTKDKGDLGLLKAQLDLFKQGFMVFHPVTEHAPFDLVIYKDRTFKRVQVKYKTVDKNGSLCVSFRSSWTDKHGTHTKVVDKKEVDLYCIYCPDTDVCYYFDPKKFKRSLTLRVNNPKNNQSKLVKLAKDFRRVP